jgi:regulator of protease activity HflC (stomatin/prohibitin superfamily)
MPLGLVLLAFVALLVLLLIAGSLFTVPTSQAAVLQRFGKFLRVASAGLNFKLPMLDTIAARINLRVQQLDMEIETKTKDNVFVRIPVSIQYLVMPDKVYEAFYKLNDPTQQIQSFVFNVILGHVPKMNLDEAFLQQADIAMAVKSELDTIMADFGYSITKALVTDIKPDDKVKAAMNDINAAQREQVAASARGETEKILKVKQAEADAESKALQGQGIANQRKAIISGLQESVELFQKSVPGATPTDVLTLVMMTQYLDTLKDVGANSRTNTIMVPHSPGGFSQFFNELRNAVIIGMETAQAPAAMPASTPPSSSRPDGPSAPPQA